MRQIQLSLWVRAWKADGAHCTSFCFFCKIIKQCYLLGAKGASFWFGVCSKGERKPLWACRGPEQAHEQNWLEKSMISVTSHNHSCAHMQLCDHPPPPAPLPRDYIQQPKNRNKRSVLLVCVCVYCTYMVICVHTCIYVCQAARGREVRGKKVVAIVHSWIWTELAKR